ncbi:Fe-S cluster assembly protein HesB [Nocardiopsis sp. HNM0947]|uniref:Fe-S cluster assembly protein HesB n=1 Tax=Nocardiopsis coralli TaxID=2772213 RepID=A0ABR9P3J7_9ACTN|nr:HhH-GPD-type base excision DNA repair protein [Nocardiopsis coralli]MBE2998409.1 Fe-S cluster assembly protein HesB [Nocardiopsis coralli]
MSRTLFFTGDADADRLLSENPTALMIGMLLDQQVPMESAFAGPKKILDRLGSLDTDEIASMDPERFQELCARSPAVHRFPGSMAKRIQALCAALVEGYGGDPEELWTSGNPDGREVLRRLRALPGFGEQKAKIFLALLGKQWGVQIPGWRDASGVYGAEGARRSIADVVDDETLHEVRAEKKRLKAEAKKEK